MSCFKIVFKTVIHGDPDLRSHTLFLVYFLSSIHIYCYDNLRQRIKNQRHYFANKGPYSQRYGFSSGHVWM